MNIVERLRAHQKKAQHGISGYGKNLYENVNEFCAEIYADTGLAADRIDALEDELFKIGRMEDSPCFVCGYNGPNYYQPSTHPCAERHHALKGKDQ